MAGGEKEIGEPQYDGCILRPHRWMLDGNEIWISLQNPTTVA